MAPFPGTLRQKILLLDPPPPFKPNFLQRESLFVESEMLRPPSENSCGIPCLWGRSKYPTKGKGLINARTFLPKLRNTSKS